MRLDDIKADLPELNGQRRRRIEEFLADRFLMAQFFSISPENVPGLVPILTLNRALDHDNGALIFVVMYFLAIVTLANLNRVIG